MKVGILSDSHNNKDNLKTAMNGLKDCEVLIHCGDHCNDTMIKALSNFNGKVHTCLGNMDRRSLKEVKVEGVKMHGGKGSIKVDDKNVFFNHYPRKAEEMAETGE